MNTGSYATTVILCAGVLALIMTCATLAVAMPTVTIDTDAETYVAGDTLEVSLSASNDGEPVTVDVHVGLILPDKSILVYGQCGWTDSIEPWVTDVHIPSTFDFGPMTILTLEVPDGILGDFQFAAGLTNASTLEFIGEISFAAFRIESGQVAPTAYIDSIYPNPATQGKDTVEFRGHGLDTDGTIEAHLWLSDLDGTISTLEDFSVSARHFSAGAHTISYSVEDDDGAWSEPATGALTIIEGGQIYVNATAGADVNDGSEESPLKTITHALASAQGSSGRPVTIHVAAGTYALSANGEHFPLIMKGWISLVGEDDETTTLDAEGGAYHVILCDDVDGVTIEGFTITGGNADGSVVAEACGGGIYCYKCSPTIQNNTITGNFAVSGGGGILSYDYCSATITNNTISTNSATTGGGIFCWLSSPLISNNTISTNSATRGGGISCMTHASPTIDNNTITDNSADTGGGGISFSIESSPAISNNTITGNSAGENGGGIWCFHLCAPTIFNNAITGNDAGEDGAGICCLEESSPIISNNTIAFNSATLDGGGIYSLDSSPSIFDCIIWDNGDDLYDCSATYCCIEDRDRGWGNIHDDPLFVTGPNGDYYLDRDSPCIDAGSRSADEAGMAKYTTQAKGTPDTGVVDMGFHYPLP